MVDQTDEQRESELQFFGKMTASISHEIKNVMAIVNESAGLLEDYTVMAEKGMPIDPSRLKTVSQRVATQIQRADVIIKNLNRLAHSVDEFEKSAGIMETLELAVALTGRFADMRGVKLDFQPPSDFPTVITSPFHLLDLIWQVLDFAMDATGTEKTVGLTFETNPASVDVRFNGIGNATAPPSAAKTAALLSILGAKMHHDVEKGEIILILPKDARQQITAAC
ncbi:histidine kinase A domain protein [delta proteobacterium NaphS2]|nr:histidine kinase A domain protein [delta proteobacterium NaphS2]